ncbi:(S)-ureidoglycine aminohydrolase [Hymenobacter taeanensis]|uniref:(S)-ureidoglycine aminohydrolase n=1 Tax=Hymenobacter taeanensis TaxID=2735321 RepID=A0A6M6BMJ4_9BACT|nr:MULTISPECIES: (S)-ureidoglycine aminohydrolase [Hymenobacter]QJX48335.1 (S)-ureidoglycine aminohydrolase [Hymenobacter taeanensis]UOQ82175.1 (S)-ureidoglycine aminohydrolase [Hymenobacter sp. 5414T-23]
MEISALTRSVVKRNHAIIAPDGYINSNVPGWTNCTVNVIINEQMGARLCQTLVTMRAEGRLDGQTLASQIFFYVVEGEVRATVGGETRTLCTNQFVYVPIGQAYVFEQATEGTQLLTFHKVYEPQVSYATPGVLFGEKDDSKAPIYMNDEALRIQELLPNDLSFDMAVNIFTYDPGGHLPMVETHIMEHGLLYLQGQAIYMLDQEWYPVKKGDAIWMAPYCQQWATTMGKEPSVYIYYKNVNRFPTVI